MQSGIGFLGRLHGESCCGPTAQNCAVGRSESFWCPFRKSNTFFVSPPSRNSTSGSGWQSVPGSILTASCEIQRMVHLQIVQCAPEAAHFDACDLRCGSSSQPSGRIRVDGRGFHQKSNENCQENSHRNHSQQCLEKIFGRTGLPLQTVSIGRYLC